MQIITDGSDHTVYNSAEDSRLLQLSALPINEEFKEQFRLLAIRKVFSARGNYWRDSRGCLFRELIFKVRTSQHLRRACLESGKYSMVQEVQQRHVEEIVVI